MAVGIGFGQLFKGIGKNFIERYPSLRTQFYLNGIRSSQWSRYFIGHFPVKFRR